MYTVLSTKILSPAQKSLLLQAGIALVEYDAIKVSLNTFSAEETVENAIITSQNTVQALLNNKITVQNCFCVGEKTKAFLIKHGYQVLETTDYGKDLAEIIANKYADRKFTFFCGSNRLDIIPEILKKNAVDFQEKVLYEVAMNYKKFDRTFEGVLLFSPSGVQSFVEKNSLSETVAFCIGTTTAAVAKKHSPKVIVANKPSIENVIVQVVKYFNPTDKK